MSEQGGIKDSTQNMLGIALWCGKIRNKQSNWNLSGSILAATNLKWGGKLRGSAYAPKVSAANNNFDQYFYT
eukprot:scaffold226175_cov73-Attheya_sp.AAC.1